jgi:hypothetical protein
LPPLVAIITISRGIVQLEKPAQAHWYSGATQSTSNCAVNNTGDVNVQDDNPLSFFYSNVTSTTSAYQNGGRWNTLDPTSINTVMDSSITTKTDVVVYDEFYTSYCGQNWYTPSGGDLIGLTTCVSLTIDGSGRCEKHEIRYDNAFTESFPGDGNLKWLFCHEPGHAVGLRHHDAADPSCMVPAVDAAKQQFTEHDVGHINGGSQSLWANERLNANQFLADWGGRFRALEQTDGNFVVYDTFCPTWCVKWATNKFHSGSTAYVLMQTDGNVVIYYPNGTGVSVLCAFGTYNHPGSVLRLQTDGNLVVIAPGNVPIWSAAGGSTCR